MANLDESTSYWIKMIAHEDGSFQVFKPANASVKELRCAPSKIQQALPINGEIAAIRAAAGAARSRFPPLEDAVRCRSPTLSSGSWQPPR